MSVDKKLYQMIGFTIEDVELLCDATRGHITEVVLTIRKGTQAVKVSLAFDEWNTTFEDVEQNKAATQ